MFANNNRSLKKSKHIDIKYVVVQERVQNGQLSIGHISTNSTIADPLTQAVPADVSFCTSLKNKDDGQTKFLKPNSQR